MAFNLVGSCANLVFDPRFAAIQKFITEVAEQTGADVTLTVKHTADLGAVYVLSFKGREHGMAVSTLGEKYIHFAWEQLRYWVSRRFAALTLDEDAPPAKHPIQDYPFPKETQDNSIELPAGESLV